MLRALVYGLAALHLGPGFAFAMLAFGCDGVQPALGAFCERGTLGSFVLLTLGAWLALGVGFAIVHRLRRAQRQAAEGPTA